MWRAFFVAVGIALCVIGAECLIIERAVWAKSEDGDTMFESAEITQRDIEPAEWAPWTFLSVGAVVLLYSFSIPKRVGG